MLLLTGVLLESGCRRPAADVATPGNPPPAPAAQTLASDSTVKALAEFNQGAALLEQYKYARAVEKFEAVVAAFPAWTAARFNLGLALLNLPDAAVALDRAEAEFQRVIAVEPDRGRACTALARISWYLESSNTGSRCPVAGSRR
jgi:tetratricopeptide (TPR) repeat protein